jgi:multimeric flavodoxin WrbA
MKVVVFNGSPRKGNTFTVTKLFLNELAKCGELKLTEFSFPKDMPKFCTGCQQCLRGPREKCPHADYVDLIYEAIIEADALVFASPHFGASCMPGSMKTLFDHLSFMEMTIAPRKECFQKKAFILTTGSGSKQNIRIIKSCLINWGINRVESLGIRMFTDKWISISKKRQMKLEKMIRRKAHIFYYLKKKIPYPKTVILFFTNKFIIKKFMGEGTYTYKYWKENGYFKKLPF